MHKHTGENINIPTHTLICILENPHPYIHIIVNKSYFLAWGRGYTSILAFFPPHCSTIDLLPETFFYHLSSSCLILSLSFSPHHINSILPPIKFYFFPLDRQVKKKKVPFFSNAFCSLLDILDFDPHKPFWIFLLL